MRDFDQTGFARALLDPDRPAPEGIVSGSGAAAGDRFAIYRNNVVQSLVEALETRFPAVQQCVGEDFFAATARVFVTLYPPSSPILAFYGEDFPAFLADFEPCSELPYLADLARLEALRTHAYHAADAAPLPQEVFANLTAIDLASLRLGLHPSVFVLASPYPIATIFAMNTGGLPLAEINDWQGEEVLVARVGMRVEVRRLAPGAAVFLARLADGATLAGAAEAAFAIAENFDLTAALAGLIGLGLITKIASASHPPH